MDIWSRKHRDSDRHREKDSTKEYTHRSSKYTDDHHRSKHDKHRDTNGDDRRRLGKHERSEDGEDRVKRERSYDREGSKDMELREKSMDTRRHHNHKKKDRGERVTKLAINEQGLRTRPLWHPTIFLLLLSTDGTSTDAGKSGGISLDVLSKAEATLLKQKELAKKMKKIPMLNKGVDSATRIPPASLGGGLPQVAGLTALAKAPILRLDPLGREADENGNVVNIPKLNNLSTLKVNINKQKKDAFQILKPKLEVDLERNPHFDPRMGIDKTKLVRPKKTTFQFVEEGKWAKEAEIIKLKSQFGKTKTIIIKEKQKDPIPDVEWWDVAVFDHSAYRNIREGGLQEDMVKNENITSYMEHPRPIEPPAGPAPPPPQPLKLTKKECKKLRTQRRLAIEKTRQEMIKQGLLEPPKPKVKMSNLMKVLGSEATQNPTRIEMEIRKAAAERQQAHVDRNIARKLTRKTF